MKLRSRRGRGRNTESTPVDPTIRLTGPAFNSNQVQPYFGTLMFLNQFKNVYTDWNAGSFTHTRSSLEELATLTSGGTCSKSIWNLHQTDVENFLKDGNYTVKWDGTTGSNIAVSVTGGGVSGGSRVDANTYTFNFANPLSGDNIVKFNVQNLTAGTTFPVTNVRCVYTPYLSLHEVDGEVWCPDYLADLPDNILAYRGTGPLRIWGCSATVPEHIRPFAADAWGGYFDAFDARVLFFTETPYEVLARLCKKKNCDLICPTPLGGNQATYDLIGARLWAELSERPDVHIIITTGNENWSTVQNNASFAGPAYLNAYSAASGGRCANGAEAEAEKLLMSARGLLNAGFPREQIIITPELQLYGSWSTPFSGYGALMMQYTDTLGLVSIGEDFGQIIDRVHTAAYQHMNDGAEYPGALYNFKLLRLDWVNLTDANILAYLQVDNDELAATIPVRLAELAVTTGRTIPVGCYEWGNEVTYAYGNLSGVFPQFTIDAGNNKIVFSASFPHPGTSFTDGDQWHHLNTFIAPAGNGSNYTGPNAGTCSSSIPNDSRVYIRRVDSNSARFYFTPEDAVFPYGSDAAAKAASITLDSPPTQLYTANNYTRYTQFITRFTAFQNSAAGGTAITNMLTATIGPTKLLYPTQYFDTGGWPVPGISQNNWWGLKAGKYAPDNDRFLTFKAYNP